MNGRAWTNAELNVIREKGYSVDAEQFVNFYKSKGWKVGTTQSDSAGPQ